MVMPWSERGQGEVRGACAPPLPNPPNHPNRTSRPRHNPKLPHVEPSPPNRPSRSAAPPTPSQALPRHLPGAPSTGGERTWTDAHVGDPSLVAEVTVGYRRGRTVGCGTPHKAGGVGTQDH